MEKDTSIIAVATHRGGAAKTQTTFELSFWLARKGKRICIIDTDSQANMTDLLLAGSPPKGRCLPEIIFDGRGIDQNDIMCREFGKGIKVDFICNNANAARLEARLPSNGAPKEYIMTDLLAQLKGKYDNILIDTPPASELLSMSSLLAADGVIIPALPDAFSYEGINSVLRIVSTIQSSPRLNPSLKVLGIIVGRYHNTGIHRAFLDLYKNEYESIIIMPQIRECTKVQQAIRAKLPVLLFAPTCSAANDFNTAFNSLKNI